MKRRKAIFAFHLGVVGTACATVPDGLLDHGSAVVYTDLAVGVTHSCGVTNDGKTYCWGSDELNELGTRSMLEDCKYSSGGPDGFYTATYVCSRAPVLVASPVPLAQVVVDRGPEILGGGQPTDPYGFSCGLTAAGSAYCWGANGSGQLGLGAFAAWDPASQAPPANCCELPSAAVGTQAFTTIAAGDLHACALDATGAAYCWGGNSGGQLGYGLNSQPWYAGPSDAVAIPTLVSGVPPFTTIVAGQKFSCGLDRSGAPWCWGTLKVSAPGGGPTLTTPTRMPVDGGIALASLSATATHVCGLTASGDAYCGSALPSEWDHESAPNGDAFVQVVAIGGLATAAINPSQTLPHGIPASPPGGCGLTGGGDAYCWGSLGTQTAFDQGGAEFSQNAFPPGGPTRVVANGAHFTKLAAGSQTACGLTSDGTISCWGSDVNAVQVSNPYRVQ